MLVFVFILCFYKYEWLYIVDVSIGKVCMVFEEIVKIYYESGIGWVNWVYLLVIYEVVWYFECSNWGQLYLVDFNIGKFKYVIIIGEGVVIEMFKVDLKSCIVWFEVVGWQKGMDLYFSQFYKVSLDGGKLILFMLELVNYDISLLFDGVSFVDVYFIFSVLLVIVLCVSNDGYMFVIVVKVDISCLQVIGWVLLVLVMVKVCDGKIDLYGLMFKLINFDVLKKYLVVDYIYFGLQVGLVGLCSFNVVWVDYQVLVEFGFIVVVIDGMGMLWCLKLFYDIWYGDMGDNILLDQVVGLKELGKCYLWMDLSCVGIWGYFGGGNVFIDVMLCYFDFFKVVWFESGNYDNCNYEDDWVEKYQGEFIVDKDGKSNYDDQVNENYVVKFKGYLMLVYGMMDDNVLLFNIMLMVCVLMDVNKDFDLLLVFNVYYGYVKDVLYVMCWCWDYFVCNFVGDMLLVQYQVILLKM